MNNNKSNENQSIILGKKVSFDDQKKIFKKSSEDKTSDVSFPLNKLTHLVITGNTGTGKTKIIENIINQAIFNLPSDNAQFFVINTNGSEYLDLEACPSLPFGISSISDAFDVISTLYAIAEERLDKLNRKYHSIDEYNLTEPQPLPHLYLAIDSYSDLINRSPYKSYRAIETLINNLSEIGVPLGIHLILASRDASSNTFPSTLLAHFSVRITGYLGFGNAIVSKMTNLPPDSPEIEKYLCYSKVNSSFFYTDNTGNNIIFNADTSSNYKIRTTLAENIKKQQTFTPAEVDGHTIEYYKNKFVEQGRAVQTDDKVHIRPTFNYHL